uniref:Ig-like and fibronectin type-III domain-containing protein C25G4.10 n=2 Tax=Wuchereria bancrofti TaxID=6293 RepID=A0AAF5PID9_WUCBA
MVQLLIVLLYCIVLRCETKELHLTTSDEGYMTVIQGFAARLECMLNTCVRHASTVIWLKDDVPIFNSTKFLDSSGVDANSVLLQHNIETDKDKECTGSCSDTDTCSDGSHCVDNKCCQCASEDFTLVLKNLTFEDAGRYRCQISNQPQQLEFQLEVLESGLKGGFHENISYDYSKCCAKKGISPLCQAMCKPRDMHIHHFDPTSCKTDDYKNFLSCATEGGNRSHVQCCKTQLVPSFCYDFCSGNFQMLRKSHRLCLYYLPEIFECYNRAYLPFPEHPQDLTVNAIRSDELRVCWRPPQPQTSNKHLGIDHYTVYYKQIPSFPFLGGDDGIPLLSGDYEESIPGGVAEDDVASDITPSDVGSLKRGKRQTWLFVTHDSSTNDSTVREFKFDEVNTTDTCVTLKDLRSATRYIVYVTASNEYGMSVPSSRALAATNAIVTPTNSTLPQIEQCCSSNGVSPYCASKMCDVRTIPNALETIAISTSCRTEWSKVSPCLADGRNHTDCCIKKGVQHDCLKICGGVAEPLTMHSLLCLNLDIAAIYQCLRQGYDTRPSPPQNVTVTTVTESSAEVEWTDPAVNAHLVVSYSLFLRKDDRSPNVIEVHNVTSPHTEYGLIPDTEYTVYLQSHGTTGDSLMSTAQIFFTHPLVPSFCPHGEPLYDPNGHRYYCGAGIRDCPPNYDCVVAGTSETDTFCCSKPLKINLAKDCCQQRGVPANCLSMCSNSTPLSLECSEYGDIWVQCTSEGHDHTRCCAESGIPDECISACRHPFTLERGCIEYTPLLSKCYSWLATNLPSAVANLEVTSRNSSSVIFSWDIPLQRPSDVYQVTLEKSTSVFRQINVTTNSARIDDLQPSTNYTAFVTGFNKFGSSPPSFKISFETLPDNEQNDRPVPPFGLHIVWNHGRRINITWNWSSVRYNGQRITDPVTYTVNYVSTGNASVWNSVKTQNMWYVMENLTMNSLYEVYVYVSDGNLQSRSSSVVTVLAAPDEYSLPEPQITITPANANRTYRVNEQIAVKCTVHSDRVLNLDLLIGKTLIHSEPSKMTVETFLNVAENNNLITCTVMDTDGRQNRAQMHIFVQFGPIVNMVTEQIYAYDDLSAEIQCIVQGYPEPMLEWHYRKSPNTIRTERLNDPVLVKTTALNQYVHTLLIKNVTGRNGIYSCKAIGADGTEITKSAELNIAKAALPLTPRFILQCCVEAKISEKCLRVCSVNPEIDGDCSAFSEDLLRCANDGRDHRTCCMRTRIPSDCLSMCSGNKVSNNALCSIFASRAVACMIRGHERAPSPPTLLRYENVSPDSVKISWNETEADPYKVYAIYYRQENSNGNFTVVKTSNTEVVIDGLDPNTNYDLALVSANALGHSPFLETKIISTFGPTRSHTFISAFFFTFLVAAAASFVVYTIRTNAWLRVIQKLHRSQPLSDRDPSVAFENPGYGTEVQIRGLAHSDPTAATEWQNADLEVADNLPTEANNGMRYAKLNSS